MTAAPSTMRAAVLNDGDSQLTIETIEHGDPGPREVLLRIEACGLCHSDYHLVDGTLNRPRPIVLGHEAVGVVEAVGSQVSAVAVGDRVVTCLVIGCGTCTRCESGEPVLCLNPGDVARPKDLGPRLRRGEQAVGQMAGIGSIADYALMDERGVVTIDHDIPAPLAAILGCAVVTGLGAVFNVACVQPGDTVAVVGCGGVGLNVVQGARIAGASRIIAVDVADTKLEMARTLGATDTVNSSAADAVAFVKELTGPGVDHAFEVVGRPATAALAFDLAANGRTAYVVGVMPDDAQITIPALGMRRGKSLQGVFMGSTRPRVDVPRYIEMWRRGLLDLDNMVSRTVSLDDVNEGFAAMTRGEVARSVVTFE